MAKYCDFCGKKLGFFEQFNSTAKSDGLQICDACYHSYWEKQADDEKHALILARLVRDRGIEGPLKTTIVKKIRQLHPDGKQKTPATETKKDPEPEKKDSSTKVVTKKSSSKDCFLSKGTHTICGYSINNPCVYVNYENESGSIYTFRNISPIKNVDYELIAQESLNKKNPCDFSDEETLYFFNWLAHLDSFDDFPPHCFSRFFDSIFHRSLIEKKNQLEICNKIIEICHIYGRNYAFKKPKVELLRLFLAIIYDSRNVLEQSVVLSLLKDFFNELRCEYYFFKSGWCFDPVGVCLELGFSDLIPTYLPFLEGMAIDCTWENYCESWRPYIAALVSAYSGIVCASSESQELHIFFTGESTDFFLKNFSGDGYSFSVKEWHLSGSSVDIISNSYKRIYDYFNQDTYAHELMKDTYMVNTLKDSDVYQLLWFILPEELQMNTLDFYKSDIKEIAEAKPGTIRDLFAKVNIKAKGKNINPSNGYSFALNSISRVFTDAGYPFEIESNNPSLDTKISFKKPETQEEINRKLLSPLTQRQLEHFFNYVRKEFEEKNKQVSSDPDAIANDTMFNGIMIAINMVEDNMKNTEYEKNYVGLYSCINKHKEFFELMVEKATNEESIEELARAIGGRTCCEQMLSLVINHTAGAIGLKSIFG